MEHAPYCWRCGTLTVKKYDPHNGMWQCPKPVCGADFQMGWVGQLPALMNYTVNGMWQFRS